MAVCVPIHRPIRWSLGPHSSRVSPLKGVPFLGGSEPANRPGPWVLEVVSWFGGFRYLF